MGIIRLGEFLKKSYPQTFKTLFPQSFKGQTYAIDASSTIYSFLAKTITHSSSRVSMPTDSHGNMTGHLLGLMYRAQFCKEIGINTVWVFDGKPPRQKSDELYRRRELKEQASQKVDSAREEGDLAEVARQSKRMIYITQAQRQDAKRLIELMGNNCIIEGMPVIQAKAEAQAQCAWLNKNKYVDGVIGEDLDTIVFGASRLVKNFKRDDESTIVEFNQVIDALSLTQLQFIDFCILCGCDYTSKIAGIGPVKALKLIRQAKNIEGVIDAINADPKLRAKHTIPDDFNHLIARRLFQKPLITQVTLNDLTQNELQEDELRLFFLEREFNQKRVQTWISKVKKIGNHQTNIPK